MSNLLNDTECTNSHHSNCDTIELILDPKNSSIGGGFNVKRVLPHVKKHMVGPWIFFDHFGPIEHQPGFGLDVRPHPHINLATVTYLFDGHIMHRDSIGSAQVISPGDINLMVAGSGITHSERTPPDKRKSGQKLHGLQLWLALPEQYEETTPEFYHHAGTELPQKEISQGVKVRVMIGEAFGLKSPVKTFSNTNYFEAFLQKDTELKISKNINERAIYVASGQIRIANNEVAEHHMAILKPGLDVNVTASKDTQIALIGGDPIGNRHIWWNFVSSDMTRIEAATLKWQNGEFDPVVGDEDEYIPLPKNK